MEDYWERESVMVKNRLDKGVAVVVVVVVSWEEVGSVAEVRAWVVERRMLMRMEGAVDVRGRAVMVDGSSNVADSRCHSALRG